MLKKTCLAVLLVLISYALWASGKTDEGSSDVGIEQPGSASKKKGDNP